MLPLNIMKSLALVGFAILLLLLAATSGGQADQDEKTVGDKNGTDEKAPELPPVNEEFKRLLNGVLNDDQLAESIARYLEVAPSSHKSRSAITSLMQAVLPQLSDGNEDDKKPSDSNSTEVSESKPRQFWTPNQNLVKLVVDLGECNEKDDCSDLVCTFLNRKQTRRRSHSDRREAPEYCVGPDCIYNSCRPCPVPEYCPLPDICKKCPDKPVCPCNREPTSKLIPETPTEVGSTTTSKKPTSKPTKDREEMVQHWPYFGGHHRRGGRFNHARAGTTSVRPTTGSSTTRRRARTTKMVVSSSSTPKPAPTTTSKAPESGSSTTKKAAASSSMKPTVSSSSSMKPTLSSSSSSTTTTTTPSTSTTAKAQTTTVRADVSSTTPGKRKVIKETLTNSSKSKKIVDIDGKQSEVTSTNSTVNDLEYLQLENGLKMLIKNKTVVQYITNAVNALPFRSGGLEGRMADRVVRNLGKDTSHWQVRSRGKHRDMTYSTLRRHMVMVLNEIIASMIWRDCKHCVDKCKSLASTLPDDEMVCKGRDGSTSTTLAPTAKPRSGQSRSGAHRACPPCWMWAQACPAPPGCIEYTCPLSEMSCKHQKEREADENKTTVSPSMKPPSSTSPRPPSSSTSAKPSSASTSRKPSSASTSMKPSSSTTSTKPSSASTSAKPTKATEPTPQMIDKRDPDFAPDDLSAPRLVRDSSAQLLQAPDLDDLDLRNQLLEEDRFKELACNGSICADQKSCGAADLNELTPKKKQTGYIVHGEAQKYGEWPSFARVEIELNGLEKSLCAGVLIGKRHVLTAGHCVRQPKKTNDSTDNGKKLAAHQLEVVLGEHDRDKKDKFETRHKVEKICFSSKFHDPKDQGSRFDFAILTMKNETTFNDHVQPACLPYKPFPIGRSKCFVIGQGKMLSSDFRVSPRYVQKMQVSRKPCQVWGFNEHDRSRWCFTKSRGPGDTCNGDSGGPVLCRNKDNKWYVMGLVSYGSELCDGAESPGWIAVYSRIPSLLEQMHVDCLNDS